MPDLPNCTGTWERLGVKGFWGSRYLPRPDCNSRESQLRCRVFAMERRSQQKNRRMASFRAWQAPLQPQHVIQPALQICEFPCLGTLAVESHVRADAGRGRAREHGAECLYG